MKYLNIFLIAFLVLCVWQSKAQEGYQPVRAISKIERDTATVTFPEQDQFKNTVTGKRVKVLHSLKNTGFRFYNSVSFKNKKEGLIAGGTGLRIRVTHDGGQHWKSFSFSRFANAFYSTAIQDGNYFVVGASRYIFRSRDFGKNWEVFDVVRLAENKYGLQHPKFYKIKFTPTGFGLIMGENSGKPFFLKTTDDGETWQLIHSKGFQGDEKLVSDAVIFPDTTIRVVTSKGNVYESQNEGKNWSLLRIGKKNESLNSIVFKNKEEGYVSGLRGLLLKTEDGGKTWQKINTAALSRKANISNLVYTSTGQVMLTTAKGYQDKIFDTFVYTLDELQNISPVILKKEEKEKLYGNAYGLCLLKNTLFVLCRDNLYETSFQQK